MKFPEIIFTYSKVYDKRWQEVFTQTHQSKEQSYPSSKEIIAYIFETVAPQWEPEEQKIFQQLHSITNLTWDVQQIICYVVGRVRPFSDPLTLPIFPNNAERFIDALTHELIHQLFIQPTNRRQLQPVWKAIRSRYPDETQMVLNHILLHAIHQHIYLTLYGEERLNQEKAILKQRGATEYLRAWEIVTKETPQAILHDFTKSG